MARKPIDQYYMDIAKQVSSRTTCRRRAVGCVIVDDNNFILSTGYNGVPQALGHCIDAPCPGAKLVSGSGLNVCEAIHAEQNALVRLKEFDKVGTIYCTTEPCGSCAKLIAATSCKKVVFEEAYPGSGTSLLRKCGIEVTQLGN